MTILLGLLCILSPDFTKSLLYRNLVIDGQQRLTTLSLLLAALSKALRNANIEGDISHRKNNYYLFNSEEQQDLRFKMVLTRNDKETFFSIIEDQEYFAL
jgi:uncharacterized protein with ParB-like and HNH nuclease domain